MSIDVSVRRPVRRMSRGPVLAGLAFAIGLAGCSAAADVSGDADAVTSTPAKPVGPVERAQPDTLLPHKSWGPLTLRGSLLVTRVATLYLVHADSAGDTPAVTLGYQPYAVHVSPDGTKVSTLHYDTVTGVLCVIDLREDSRLCARITGVGPNAMAWTPDSRSLIIGGGPPAGAATWRLSLVDARSLEMRPMLTNTANGAGVQSVTFTPDGSTVTFVLENRLWRMAMVDSAAAERVPGFDGLQNLWAAQWSPDGRAVALLAWHETNHTLSVVNADGTNRRVLATVNHNQDTLYDRPLWSPDGQQLGLTLFDCTVEPCENRVAVASLDGRPLAVRLQNGMLHAWR